MKPLLSVLAIASTAAAECSCGYTVNRTDSGRYALFTDLLETDFLHVQDNYNTSAATSNGPYGMAKQLPNIIPNYVEDRRNYVGPGIESLWVRSTLVGTEGQKLVPSAEIVSQRDDILFGSFRIAMKTTAINGTCSAFFFYRNDSQEVDLEILSREQHNDKNDWPVHLVVQNTTAASSPNYRGSSQLIYQMAFPPGGALANYNEYRFDWLPDRIDYYINGWHAWTTTENIPSTAARIHISQWSNGNAFWSGGPPLQDAVLTVSYVKAYFNSTNTTRTSQYSEACSSEGRTALRETCKIPDQNVPPNPFGSNGNDTGSTFFFTQHHNMTINQTVYNTPLNGLANGFSNMMDLKWVAVVLAAAVAYVIFQDVP